MTVLQLALDEFDLLPGIRIYWEYTARKIERWAFKLRLKGEFLASEPNDRTDVQSLKDAKQSKRNMSARPINSNVMLSLLTPQKIKWNIRMDPVDGNVSGDLQINSHLSFNARLGNDSQVGLSFRYAF